jgi:hypothetical protein
MNKGKRKGALANVSENERKIKKKSKENYRK